MEGDQAVPAGGPAAAGLIGTEENMNPRHAFAATAVVLVTGLGYAVAAQPKPAAASSTVMVYKSPT
jgi:hypothetical protein